MLHLSRSLLRLRQSVSIFYDDKWCSSLDLSRLRKRHSKVVLPVTVATYSLTINYKGLRVATSLYLMTSAYNSCIKRKSDGCGKVSCLNDISLNICEVEHTIVSLSQPPFSIPCSSTIQGTLLEHQLLSGTLLGILDISVN